MGITYQTIKACESEFNANNMLVMIISQQEVHKIKKKHLIKLQRILLHKLLNRVYNKNKYQEIRNYTHVDKC